ncbi:MAG: hypothetical protein JRK53_23985 [Deltaproteobacteria bacterium]|nr:hypothetical protein [Deltaproteobacteria bacterium]
MTEWIPFNEGDYIVDRAFLFTSDGDAVHLENAVVSAHRGPGGRMRMEGACRIRNALLVELLEDHERIDLALDFGDKFTYLLKDPVLRSGKVFSPDVTSHLQFVPRARLEHVSPDEFEALLSGLTFLGVSCVTS